MQVIVLADELQKEELLKNGSNNAEIVWIDKVDDFLKYKEADAFADLGFVNDEQRKALLKQLLPKLVVVNAVAATLKEIDDAFVRINGWNTFLSSPLLEAASVSDKNKTKAEEVFAAFTKKLQWCADDAGFVTARVVSMIINEAYLALAEGVSTKEEINTAMKLGTAYPYGPFEWAEKIGLKNIVALLQKLGQTQPRYTPASLLVEEAG